MVTGVQAGGAALAGDTNTLLALLEAGHPFVVDTVSCSAAKQESLLCTLIH